MRALAAVVAGALFFACPPGPNDGPAEVKWDRDACQNCSMVISERHFAAQVRGGPKSAAAKFDDIGCAVKWLDKQPWAAEPATKVWVAQHADGAWLDAKTARYVAGKTSPMGFNFGAAAEGEGLTFEAMRERVRAIGAKP
jgi:nitrous oxide reductase accessory protein NosL